MRKFGYTIVTYSRTGVNVQSTDFAVLQMAESEATKIAPRCFSLGKLRNQRPSDYLSQQLPNGEFYYNEFSKLDGKDRVFGWWLIKMFLSTGWEPFYAEHDGAINTNEKTEAVHLRIEYEDKA